MHPIVSISHIKTIHQNNQLEWSFTLYQSVAYQLYETSHCVKVLQTSHMTVGYFKVMPKKMYLAKPSTYIKLALTKTSILEIQWIYCGTKQHCCDLLRRSHQWPDHRSVVACMIPHTRSDWLGRISFNKHLIT
jgi:hypothetical protein